MKKINFITILILLILLGIIAIVLFFLVKNNPNVENNSEYGENGGGVGRKKLAWILQYNRVQNCRTGKTRRRRLFWIKR